MKRTISLVFTAILLMACAGGCVAQNILGLDGSGQVNGASGPSQVEKKKGYVFLYADEDCSITPAPIPAGAARLYGDLYSTFRDGSQNITWKDPSIDDYPVERDAAWFYIDYKPATGEILDARAYAKGFNRNTINLAFFEKYKGGFGKIGGNGFEINIAGVSGGNGTWQGVYNIWEGPAAIFIKGKGDLLNPKKGAKFNFTYQIDELAGAVANIENKAGFNGDDTDVFSTEQRKKDQIFDKGKGAAVIQMGK